MEKMGKRNELKRNDRQETTENRETERLILYRRFVMFVE